MIKYLFIILSQTVKVIGALILATLVSSLPHSNLSRIDRFLRWIQQSVAGQIFFFLFVAGGVGTAMLIAYLMFNGPRMRTQPSILPYQAVMPLAPLNSVPLIDPVPSLPSTQVVSGSQLSLESTRENLARGKVYYQYYCLFCHGERGDSNVPVGESYVPVPASLRNNKFQRYSDEQLLYAMLTGTGHEPVLARVVSPEYRKYLVLYIRQFSSSQPASSP